MLLKKETNLRWWGEKENEGGSARLDRYVDNYVLRLGFSSLFDGFSFPKISYYVYPSVACSFILILILI